MTPALTSFRFFAFFPVLLFHQLLFPAGYLGVQAFFVLSGFLLTAILVKSREQQGARDYFVSFYGRRALRIFPVYYAYLLLVGLLLLPWFLPDGKSDIPVINRFYQQLPWAATYTYNVFHASDSFKHTYLLTHFWSLAIEEQFYLLWPVLIYLVPARRLKLFLLAIVCAGPLLRWWTGELVKSGSMAWLGNDAGLVVYVSPFSHLDAFALGGYAALYGKTCSGQTPLRLLGIVVVLGLASSAWWDSQIDWWGFGYSNFMGESSRYVWGYTVFNLFCASALLYLRDRTGAGPWCAPPLVYLGGISYGLYVFHNAFIWLAGLCFPEQIVARFVFTACLTLLASALSYRYLEKPCLALKDRYFPSSSRNNLPL